MALRNFTNFASMKKPGKKSIRTRLLTLDGFLFRHSWMLFLFFFVMALWAFWSSYYGRLSDDMPFHVRFHGVTMTIWCIMLIGQATLIRFNLRGIHRFTGMLSYLLVPLIIYSGMKIAHFTISRIPPQFDMYHYQTALMFNALFAFAILYLLAIIFRKRPAIHGRFMLSSIFPLFTPITDRIIYKNYRWLVDYAPTINEMPVVPALGFALANVLILLLLIWDWRVHQRVWVFLTVLGVILLYHTSVLTFYSKPFWRKIGQWLVELPIY